ncbi:bifunctional metallophosphatase/5'-nucleotidase [Nocardioides pocheonensis]|uniref:Bifunctional metallophosphatase/5'-nucleotidase n=1 Tax=Nocardioides pocheonensis TaxID=661485 RepID=A0A3N0GV94_9ACTN|nr:bifunctional metallophosphatase/5'-nucleotidase [Nocardioides pocheonensis]RNM16393.1 bifunctional metallophosphatase/5'-nucleotidase [Nocardioides pocheonensis]
MHLTPRPRVRSRLIGVLTATLVALSGVAATQASSAADPTRHHPGHHHKHKHHRKLMNIQILSFNDFHGNLEPPTGSSGRIVVGHRIDPSTGKPVDVTQDVGGVEYLSTHLAQARAHHRNSLTVAAGDIIGASPLLSAAFHDEPTIEAMNTLGLDVSAVGNHEFDEGYRELQRMQYGGCIDDGNGANNQNSCPAGVFQGANFDLLAANVFYAGSNRTILPAYTIKKVHGARIGFIGMTLKDTPSIVTASGVQGLEFKDEVATANALVPVLRRQGVKAIIVLIHQGGVPDKQQWTDPSGKTWAVNPNYDYACGGGGSLIAASSPILGIAANLDPQIDMVVSGHTHQPYVCSVRDPAGHRRLLTSASSFGRLFTETDLKYDKRKGDIVRASVKGANFPVTRDVAKDPAETSLIAKYQQLVRPIASKVIGHITTDVTAAGNAAGESQLGDLIADAQLADPSTVTGGQTPVIAFMNPGGIRADLTYANSKYGEPAGDVTFEEAFSVQPFNNYLVSMTLTGQDIYDLLAQQLPRANVPSTRILQVSQGFTYQLGASGAVDGTVKLNGTPIDKAASYRIVTNNFLSDGGDSFPAFTHGTGKYFGGLDIDAFADHLTAVSPYTPGPLTRITQ